MQQQELGLSPLSFLFYMLELFCIADQLYPWLWLHLFYLEHAEQTWSVVLFCNESLYFDDKFGFTF